MHFTILSYWGLPHVIEQSVDVYVTKPMPLTVLPGKRDSGVMFCLEIIMDLSSIDQLCINPIHRIGLIHK